MRDEVQLAQPDGLVVVPRPPYCRDARVRKRPASSLSIDRSHQTLTGSVHGILCLVDDALTPDTFEALLALDDFRTPAVYIFADESTYRAKDKSGKETGDYFYAVGAVVIEGAEILGSMTVKLQELRVEAAHDPALRNHKDARRLTESGWHLSEDQVSTAVPLWQFIGDSLGVKFHYRYFTSHAKIPGDKLDSAYAVLHGALARDLLPRYESSHSIDCFFEEYTGLNAKFADLISWCAGSIKDYDGPYPEVRVLSKGQSDLLSLADYMILGTSRLLAENDVLCGGVADCAGECRRRVLDRDAVSRGHVASSSMHYRNFNYFQQSVSSSHEVRLHPGVLA